MRRRVPVLWAVVLVACASGSVHAQGEGQGHRPTNAIQFRLGGFLPRGGGDIWPDDEQLFTLDRSDFDGAMVGFTYAMSLDNHFELGFNLDFYEETVGSEDRNFVDQNGLPILHDTRFQLIPATVDFRFLPTGRYGIRGTGGQRRVLRPVPYIGAGLGAKYWEYEEVGDFVDPADSSIFSSRSIATGTAFETHVLAGLELPINPQFNFLIESRYSWADATPGGDFAGFGTLDLSGFSGYVGFAYRF
jgi:hypothetical protein